MPTLETVDNSAAEQHFHEAGLPADEAQCPYCGQPISRKQYRQIVARIGAEARERVSKVEQTLKDRFARDMEQAIAKTKKDAARAAEQQVKSVKASQEEAIKQRLLVQREALDKQKAKAVSDEKARAYEERLRLEEKLQELTRQLQNKTAHELGEPAECDLYETLQAEFRGDEISRVAKGVKGPDIILEVVHNGAVAGSIVIDCKNHKKWQSVFTKKLRNDQLARGADFAILSSSTFPKGGRQLHITGDHIIIADPARVTVLVHLLRRQIIQNHMLKLGSEARNEKACRLLDFIISPVCTDLLERIVKLTEELVALDRTETAAHQKTWTRRADLIRGVQQFHDDFAASIDRIISTEEPANVEAQP
jgi:hypothetical protein